MTCAENRSPIAFVSNETIGVQRVLPSLDLASAARRGRASAYPLVLPRTCRPWCARRRRAESFPTVNGHGRSPTNVLRPMGFQSSTTRVGAAAVKRCLRRLSASLRTKARCDPARTRTTHRQSCRRRSRQPHRRHATASAAPKTPSARESLMAETTVLGDLALEPRQPAQQRHLAHAKRNFMHGEVVGQFTRRVGDQIVARSACSARKSTPPSPNRDRSGRC